MGKFQQKILPHVKSSTLLFVPTVKPQQSSARAISAAAWTQVPFLKAADVLNFPAGMENHLKKLPSNNIIFFLIENVLKSINALYYI